MKTLSLYDPSRRLFLKGLGALGGGLAFGLFGGCESWIEAIKNRPLRRRLRLGSPAVDADIATYRQAVTLMKALPASDPRSWQNQALIHGEPAHFNFCQHGTPHFFDWHRAYLFYFEKICQKLTGNSSFGLPYWNWNQNPDLHPAFLDPSSTLFMQRARNSASGASAITTAELDPIFDEGNFYTFSSLVEGTPHNTIHGYIGGGNVFGGGGSARDPIFWAHHCMVDYSWAKWNLELGFDNTNDPAWTNVDNSHFVDADGNPASIKAALTTIMPLLSYRYESSAIGSSPAKELFQVKRDFQLAENRVRAGADIHFTVKQRLLIQEAAAITVARPFSKILGTAVQNLSGIIDGDPSKERVFASIEYARLPATSDFFVRVFINLPGANAGTSTADPHYAGSFAFFGTATPGENHEGHHHAPLFLVNISDALQRLKRVQAIAERDRISVQLVAVPFGGKFEKEDTELILNKIELIVTPVVMKTNS